ncbi:MAG TPA: metallophosphoesterase [Steroidobacteraceae bacterium]|nr:metallophosphoesterase [Steroidobacteraceae bacterium]
MTSRRLVQALFACVLACGCSSGNAAPGTYFVSDMHLGVGQDAPKKWSALEDFRWNDAFEAFLNHLSASTGDEAQLVILGDMVELWQSSRMECKKVLGVVTCDVNDCVGRATGCSEQEALDRLRHVVAQHGDTLQALGRFAARGRNRVIIVPGNHDAALLFPAAAELLKKAIGGPADRVIVEMSGRWLSEDGKVLAEHGHQFDKVNSFDGWPKPFVDKGGKPVMERPGGELLVQTFYNRYEQQFEAIDNFGTETEGIGYAVNDLGAKGLAVGTAELYYFFTMRSTIEQRFDWLGQEPEAGQVEWNVAQIRKENDARFVVDSLEPGSPEQQVLLAAYRKRELASLFGQLTDEDIQTACDRVELFRAERAKEPGKPPIESCPSTAGADANLGYFAGKVLQRDDQDMIAYLADTQNKLPDRSRAFALYVYGHTHSAKQPRPVEVTPEWEVTVVNTGAFQRIASHDFIAGLPVAERNDPTFLSKLTLDRLPECYSFVALKNAGQKPAAALRYWRRDAKTQPWRETEECTR